MVASRMAVALSESQQGKVDFLALYDLWGILEFVSFIKASMIGKISPILGKENPLNVLYLSWSLQALQS